MKWKGIEEMPQAIPDKKERKQSKAFGLSVRVLILALNTFPIRQYISARYTTSYTLILYYTLEKIYIHRFKKSSEVICIYVLYFSSSFKKKSCHHPLK